MNKKIFVFATIIFALFCIWILNFYLKMEYSNHGSFDIVVGAFVEVFILTVFFHYIEARNEKKMEQRLQNHLDKIEQLINKKG